MATKASSLFHFPSQDVIISYFKQHPSIKKDPYLGEKRIIDTMAKVFANRNDVSERMVDLTVIQTLYQLKLGMEDLGLIAIQKNISRVLKDCAEGKPIAAERVKMLSKL